jgi:hypothetical protein
MVPDQSGRSSRVLSGSWGAQSATPESFERVSPAAQNGVAIPDEPEPQVSEPPAGNSLPGSVVNSSSEEPKTSSSRASPPLAFRVVRKATQSLSPKPPRDALLLALRTGIAASAAEMFVPLTSVPVVKRSIKMASVVAQFRDTSVGDAAEVVVEVLGDHRAKPDEFDPIDGQESLPVVSSVRVAVFIEELSQVLEHFKRHMTRTLLNLVVDANTARDQRFCAAAVLGLLFRFGFYGDNDPYQAVLDVLTPLGQNASAEVPDAISRLLLLSESKATPAAKALHQQLFKVSSAEMDLPSTAVSVETPKRQPAGPPPPYAAVADILPLSDSSAGQSLDDSLQEAMRKRTVYITRVDPTMSEGELRSILLECGDFNKVRLCGDTPGRCKYCFVEFASEAASKKMLKFDGRWFGTQQLRVGPAKAPIETNDPRDALFDNARGKVRACVFGLWVKPAENAGSQRPLANSAPAGPTDKQFQVERRRRNDALLADPPQRGSETSNSRESGLMNRVE